MLLGLLVYFGGLLMILFGTLCLACGLYCIAEWIEENMVRTKKILTYCVFSQMGMLLLLLITDRLPFLRVFFAIFVHYIYSLLVRDFPIVDLSNPVLIISLVLSLVNHFVWFQYFTNEYFPYFEIVTFFTLFVWITPFCLFLSLSASDNILPSTNTDSSSGGASGKQQNFFKSWIQYFSAMGKLHIFGGDSKGGGVGDSINSATAGLLRRASNKSFD